MFYSYTLQVSVKIKMRLWNKKEKARQIFHVRLKEKMEEVRQCKWRKHRLLQNYSSIKL